MVCVSVSRSMLVVARAVRAGLSVLRKLKRLFPDLISIVFFTVYFRFPSRHNFLGNVLNGRLVYVRGFDDA